MGGHGDEDDEARAAQYYLDRRGDLVRGSREVRVSLHRGFSVDPVPSPRVLSFRGRTLQMTSISILVSIVAYIPCVCRVKEAQP